MGLFNFLKKKEEIKKEITKTYILEFPFRGRIDMKFLGEDAKDDKYISGKEIYSYLDKETIEGINYSWNGSEMTQFIDNKQVKRKVADMELSIKNNGTCNMYIKTYEELTNEDKDYLLAFVKGQASDGWGEGDFDYIYDKANNQLFFYWDYKEKAKDKNCIPFSINFWWYKGDWYIKYIEI